MAIVNIGLQRTRDLVAGVANVDPVDSIGFGTDPAAENPADARLGAVGASYWKTDPDTQLTSGGDGTADPWWQLEATWSSAEANATLYELGTSAGELDGEYAAADATQGALLYTRKRIGGAGGITKTTDIELVGRVKVIY